MSFKNKFLITFLITIFTQGFVLIAFISKNDRKHIDFESKKRLNRIEDIYKINIELSTCQISSLISLIANNKEIKNIFKKQDRDELYFRCIQDYQSLNEKQDVTHFYFHNIDRTNFLRVHNSKLYGDDIDRFTLKLAKTNNS